MSTIQVLYLLWNGHKQLGTRCLAHVGKSFVLHIQTGAVGQFDVSEWLGYNFDLRVEQSILSTWFPLTIASAASSCRVSLSTPNTSRTYAS
jgi:hypothetical protein